jgi:hypothetical protein
MLAALQELGDPCRRFCLLEAELGMLMDVVRKPKEAIRLPFDGAASITWEWQWAKAYEARRANFSGRLGTARLSARRAPRY